MMDPRELVAEVVWLELRQALAKVPPLAWVGLGVAGLAASAVAYSSPVRLYPGPRVRNRQRAAGVVPELVAFLDWWELHGPFTLTVVEKGGVRADDAEQLALFNSGKSKAATLKETPHGRAAAVDLAPWVANAPYWKDRVAFFVLGRTAKARGLEWGGDFPGLFDGGHVQVAWWRALPFPVVRVA